MGALFPFMSFVVFVGLNPTSATMDAISQLQKDVASLKNHVNSQEQKFSALLSNILSKITSFNTEFADVKSNIVKLQVDYHSSSNDIRNFTKDLSSLEDMTAANENEIQWLRMNSTGRISDILKLQAEFQTSSKDILNFTKTLALLENRMQANENEIQWLQMNATDCQGVFKSVNASLSQIAGLNTSFTSLKKNIEVDYTTLSLVKSEISALQLDVRSNGDVITATNLTLNSELMKLAHAQTTILQNMTMRTGNSSNVVAFDTEYRRPIHFNYEKTRPLIFTTVYYNAGSGYDVTTGVFTAPTTGLYLIWMNVAFATRARGGSQIYIQTPSRVVNPIVQNDQSDDSTSLKSKRLPTGNAVRRYTEIRNIFVPIQKGEKVWLAATNSLQNVMQGSAFGGLLIHEM